MNGLFGPKRKKLTLNVGRWEGLPHIVGAYNVLEANYCPIPFFMRRRDTESFSTMPTLSIGIWDIHHRRPIFLSEGGKLDVIFLACKKVFREFRDAGAITIKLEFLLVTKKKLRYQDSTGW